MAPSVTDIWPPLYTYALAYACPTCKVSIGTMCDAPRKTHRANRFANAISHPDDMASRLHSRRNNLGRIHRNRDISKAPWADERKPGRRYDTLGDRWMPNQHTTPTT